MDSEVLSDEPLWRILLDSSSFYFVALADELGLFELLAKQPDQSIDFLAEHYQTRIILVESLIEYLLASDLLTGAPSTLRLTPIAEKFLLRDSRNYWGNTFAGWRRYDLYQEIRSIFLSGDTQHLHTARWKEDGGGDSTTPPFLQSMQSMNLYSAEVIAERGYFADQARLLDVAGGTGCYSIEACRAQPKLLATVMELAAVSRHTEQYVVAAGFADRIRVVAGDLFQGDWPPDHDAVLLSNVLHDWDRADGVRILRNAHAALESGGDVLVHEMLLPETPGPDLATGFSLLMFYRTEGRQRRLSEIASMLAETGFSAPTVSPGAHDFSLVRARRLESEP